MYSLPPSMELKFKFYLNILPVMEQCMMYIGFIVGTILILITTYILTFKIMFKSYNKKNPNVNFRTNIWIEREKRNKMSKDDIYAPCEVPLSDTDSDQAFDTKPMFVKSQSERLKELGHRLSGKVYDVRGKFELAHSKHSKANDRKNSLINPEESQDETNEAFKSDTSESDNEVNTKYREVKQTDSEEDYKYLEVLDDGSEFDDYDSRKDNSKKDLRIRIE